MKTRKGFLPKFGITVLSFICQFIRGSYTRDDEKTIADVKKGELYLMSGGQLRLYFKDIARANIKFTF